MDKSYYKIRRLGGNPNSLIQVKILTKLYRPNYLPALQTIDNHEIVSQDTQT